jgi:hypothetical protein
MSYPERGILLFLQNPKLFPGAAIDLDHIDKGFRSLGFKIMIGNDLTAREMLDTVKELAITQDFARMDCFACFISPHDTRRGVLQGSDSALVNLDELIEPFARNKSLIGKPKLFFIDACGSSWLKTTSLNDKNSSPDIFVLFSSREVYVSFSDLLSHGSWFVNSVSKVLIEHGKVCDLKEIALEIGDRVSNKMVYVNGKQCLMSPFFHSSLTQRMFFRPFGKIFLFDSQ